MSLFGVIDFDFPRLEPVGKDVQVVLLSDICFMNVVAGGEYGCVVGVGPDKGID